MPNIRPSSDLRNKYNEISDYCHKTNNPVFLTKNGSGDLVVMSIERYELLTAREELRQELEEGIKSLKEGKTIPAKEVFENIKKI